MASVASVIRSLFTSHDASSPAAETVVPGTPFTVPSRAIYIGTGGDLVVQMLDGNNQLYPNVASSFVLPAKGLQVVAAGTTASNMVAMF